MNDKEKETLKDVVVNIFDKFNILEHTATIGGLKNQILSFIDSLQDEPKGKICPHCGAVMKLQEDRVYTSNPPKYGYTCPKCGALEFDTEYLYRRLKEIETKAAKQS